MGDSTSGDIPTASRVQAECASKAVAFVIKHSQRGIVSLCTNIAAIMEERDRLLEENKELKQKVEVPAPASFAKTHRDAANVCPASTQTNVAEQHGITRRQDVVQEGHSTTDLSASLSLSSSVLLTCLQTNRTINMLQVLRELSEVAKSWLPLEDCLCERCTCFPGTKACSKTLTLNLLGKGCQVVVRDKWLGTVRYVGHLDCSAPCGVWVGLDLEEPVGFTDGSLGSKTYFSCKPRCGIFVNVSSVTYVLR